jgi:adenylate cyclase
MERKLTAILCADVHGYSRLMGEDEEATIRNLSAHRRTIDGLIEQYRGRFVNSAGDSVLAEFASAVHAVECAVAIQTALKTDNAEVPPGRRMEFRIGVNLGDVVVEGLEIYGDGVNVAARLESLAEPGGIHISGVVHDQVKNKLTLSYQDLGLQPVKNIAEPVHVWRVLLDGSAPSRRDLPQRRRRYWRGGILSLGGLAIIVLTVFLVQHLTLKPPRTHASIAPLQKPALALPKGPSIAVLPFANLSGDPAKEYFSDGLADQLINQLSRLSGLFVIARNSSFAYKDKITSERVIGRELGVQYILEGSARNSAGQVRVGVELVDAASGRAVWAQNYDRPFKDIFAIQDEIVDSVVTTLNLIFTLDALKIANAHKVPRTANIEAFNDLLRSYGYWWRFDKDDHLRAREWCGKAIEADPNYGEAYSCLAGNYASGVLFGWSKNPTADLNRGVELAHKALALDDSNSSAWTILCAAHYMGRDYDQAVEECQRAVAIDPNSSNGYLELSDALTTSGRPQEAALAAEKAMRLDPNRTSFYAYFIAAPYVMMGRYEEALPLLKGHLTDYPNQPWAHAALIVAYVELGRYGEARTEAVELNRISPQFLSHMLINKDPAITKRWHDALLKAGVT